MAISPQPQQEEGWLPGLLSRYRAELETGLQKALERGEPGFMTMLRYHMGWVDQAGQPMATSQGKALRPLLCLFCCEAVGSQAAKAIPAAVALELIHNFSLIHDDIQDGDRERRHRPTVWYLWGKPKALMAGNVMRTIADQALLELQYQGFAASRVLWASALLTEAYLRMIEGQYLDLGYEGRADTTVQDYLEMVGCKTGALFEGAMRLGSLLGTDDPRRIEVLGRCGYALGAAFQIRDDILGLWGDGTVMGKALGADIRRRKKSLPVVYVFEHASAPVRARLTQLYAQEELSDEDVGEVLQVLGGMEAQRFAQQMAEEQCSAALAWAGKAFLPPWARVELEELADLFVRRHR